jgi:hypothetical protein
LARQAEALPGRLVADLGILQPFILKISASGYNTIRKSGFSNIAILSRVRQTNKGEKPVLPIRYGKNLDPGFGINIISFLDSI